MCTTRFLNNFIRQSQSQKIRNPNNLKIFPKKRKGYKQNSHNRLRSPMSEGEEP
jgi:hypothetical protein